MNTINPKVNWYFDKPGTWQEAIQHLRRIVLDCHLTETLKWGCPCYTFEGSNIVLIHVFKDYCAVLFFKGALLKDPEGILIQQTENVQVARQMRFTSLQEVKKRAASLRAYIFEAVEAEEQGLKAPVKKTKDYPLPEELKQKLTQMPRLEKAFKALTPGRQRAYLLYFSAAKQSKTRTSRIEKNIQKILDGKGWNEE